MNPENTPPDNAGKKTYKMTPSELVHYHLLHPEEPITDEEIRNARISDGIDMSSFENNADTEPESDTNKDGSEKGKSPFPIKTPYDVLSN